MGYGDKNDIKHIPQSEKIRGQQFSGFVEENWTVNVLSPYLRKNGLLAYLEIDKLITPPTDPGDFIEPERQEGEAPKNFAKRKTVEQTNHIKLQQNFRTAEESYVKRLNDFGKILDFVLERVDSNVKTVINKGLKKEGRSVKVVLRLLREAVESDNQKRDAHGRLLLHLADFRTALAGRMKSEDDPLIWIAYGELLEEMVNKAIEIGEEVKKDFGNRSEIVKFVDKTINIFIVEDLITANRSTLSQVSGLIQAVTSAVHNSKSKLTVDHCEKPSDWKNMIVDLVRRLKADYGTPDGEPSECYAEGVDE
ncbi:hypothetical protein HDV05_005607 [Chytridiales sp. JEL 0842]|nr:hypothetical protein HDV05_005607 [Chytridiales sp. JEL 0842]